MTTPRDDLRERLEAEAIALSVRRFTDLDDTDADALAALLREAAARLGEREWRPIEGAPKDGTIIDVWQEYSNGDGQRQADVFWDGTKWLLEVEPEPYDLEWGPDEFGQSARLTHFMPLPPPPETTK